MAILQAQVREQLTGNGMHLLRQNGMLPLAVVGHGHGTRMIKAHARDIREVLNETGGSSMFELSIEGESKPMGVILKELQRDPVTHRVIHITLQEVKSTDSIKIAIRVVFVGEPVSVQKGESSLMTSSAQVEVHAMVSKLPDEFTVDVSHLGAHESIHASDLVLPEGVELVTPPDTVLAATVLLRAQKVEAGAEAAEKAAEAPATEEA
jgi:large subunit ribosomal protein L25